MDFQTVNNVQLLQLYYKFYVLLFNKDLSKNIFKCIFSNVTNFVHSSLYAATKV